MDIATRWITESWLVVGQMAPYLLFGFLAAGVLSVLISAPWIERHLGRRGMGPVFKASLFGVPLPLCSCGVIPVAASIRRHGASRAATTAFLLSTPQTGVDSIAITYALLGPVFTIVRPLVALVTGLLGGFLVQAFDDHAPSDENSAPSPSSDRRSASPERDASRHADASSGPGAFRRALRYGFVRLPRDIGPALITGILIAGAMAAIVPKDQLHAYVGGGIVSILLLMAAGVPIYVCATASVPIAAGFLHMGASPGAALAFLIAGPATNAASLTTVWRVLGRRTALLYAVTVIISAVGGGLLLDWLVPTVERVLPDMATHEHDTAATPVWSHAMTVVLLGILAVALCSRVLRKGLRNEKPGDTAAPRERRAALRFRVSGMRCTHCSDTVKRALENANGVTSVEVDLEGGEAIVTGEHLEPEPLVAILEELGHDASPIHT